MLALLTALTCGWFVYLTYRHLGGTLKTLKRPTAVVPNEKHLRQFCADLELEVARGGIIGDTALRMILNRSTPPVEEQHDHRLAA